MSVIVQRFLGGVWEEIDRCRTIDDAEEICQNTDGTVRIVDETGLVLPQ